MKKHLRNSIFLLLVLLLITGCGCNKKKEKTDKKINEKIEENVTNMNDEVMNSLVSIDENMLMTQFGLASNEVEYFVAKIPSYNETKPKFYIAVKPAKGKKELVKKALDIYVNSLKDRASEKEKNEYDKVLKKENNGYIIYILSEDNEKVYKIITSNLK